MSLLILFQNTALNNYTITAAAGSYAVTGNAVSILATRKIVAASGSYATTGNAVALVRGKAMQVGAGSYAITGRAVTLQALRYMVVGSGAYTVTGKQVQSSRIRAEAGVYIIIGRQAGLITATTPRKLILSPNGYTIRRKDTLFA